jgi:hypothetical protein
VHFCSKRPPSPAYIKAEREREREREKERRQREREKEREREREREREGGQHVSFQPKRRRKHSLIDNAAAGGGCKHIIKTDKDLFPAKTFK